MPAPDDAAEPADIRDRVESLPKALPPIEQVVEDGVLISISTVRMAVKNALIIAALRDHADFDATALSEIAKAELRSLAAQDDETAARLEAERDAEEAEERRLSSRILSWARTPTRMSDAKRRGPEVFRLLAVTLREYAVDSERLDVLITEARDDAWREISREIVERLGVRKITFDLEPDYSIRRGERMRRFREVDLHKLESHAAWSRAAAQRAQSREAAPPSD